ncbi:MAG: PspC domain-containing protein [Crocinitomicaceae bacterium]|nr:PspC domain-containing protein [Crocinitomicaceae bacterium]MBK8924354.1 PspC domain-containing protein [Crocinitomicaceae bacterium]
MNKTISVNIGGFVFNIEEEAYQQLYQYLNRIKQNFASEDEREEIMQDIESRIAELFQSYLINGRQVVTQKDVDMMIGIMGSPEDYGGSAETTENTNDKSGSDSSTRSNNEKRLYRDTENATLGGVCAGLSHYFNLDVSIVRLIFVFLTIIGGSGLLIYLVLLIVIPEAKSTSDKLQMRGQTINIETIKGQFQKLKQDITDKAKSGKLKRQFNDTFDKGVKAGSTVVKAFSKLIGFCFIVGGAFALIVLFVVLFGDTGLLPLAGVEHTESLSTLLSILYPGSIQSSLVFISVLIVTLIPILSIMMTGAKVLFNIKRSFKALAITSSITWFIAVGLLVITGINLGMSMRTTTSVEYSVPYTDTSKVLLIDVAPDNVFSNHIIYEDVWNTTEMIQVKDEHIYLGYPELNLVQKADSGNFEITIYKKSNGLSTKDAITKAEQVDYHLEVRGQHLNLSPYFKIPVSDKLRRQQVEIEIKIPMGKEVHLGNNIDRIDVDITGENRYGEKSFANTTWYATPNRLLCKECILQRQMKQ